MTRFILPLCALVIAGCLSSGRTGQWVITPPAGVSARDAAEFSSFLRKVDSLWNRKLVDIRSKPRSGTSLVLVLVPEEGRRLRVDRIEDVTDGIEKNSVWAAVDAVRVTTSEIQFSEDLFAEFSKRGDVRLHFNYVE